MPDASDDVRFLRRAIDLATQNVETGKGGPFGALVVRDGDVLAEAVNVVTATHDPTAHAEVTAIRKACASIESFRLDGCTLYTSCEPCPMCMGAVYWSHLDRVVYGAVHADAARVGFDDSHIYDELCIPREARSLPMEQHLSDHAQTPFQAWADAEDREEY